MPKTLGIWEWGCPKRGDAQNAVTGAAAEDPGYKVRHLPNGELAFRPANKFPFAHNQKNPPDREENPRQARQKTVTILF